MDSVQGGVTERQSKVMREQGHRGLRVPGFHLLTREETKPGGG